MTIPYNLVPMEVQMAMITAEQARVPVLTDAARMWTEVHQWIKTASTELNTHAGQLTPEWKDEAGQAYMENIQSIHAKLKMHGERLDAAQVPATLTTLAAAIPATLHTVTPLYESYLAALSNPLTAPGAVAFQQAAGTAMTALGAQYDQAMLKMAAGVGVESPADLLPAAPDAPNVSVTGTPAEFIKMWTSGVGTASAGLDTLTALQGLGSSGTGGTSTAALSAALPQTGSTGSTGLSLAGLAPTLPTPASIAGGSFGSLPTMSGPPVPAGGLGLGGSVGAAGLMPVARPVAGKQAPTLASEVKPGWASESATAEPALGTVPPMMSRFGQGTAGTLQPGSFEESTGPSVGVRKSATGPGGVPANLRGRSGSGDSGDFTLSRRQRGGETESGSVQLLDEDLWQ